MRKLTYILIFLLLISLGNVSGQYKASEQGKYSRQDRLRGSITPEREWWDLLHYHLSVEFLPRTKRIRGSNVISFKTLKAGKKMQIDLQPPLAITKIRHRNSDLKFEREGNVYWVSFPKMLKAGKKDKIKVYYEGKPVESKNPPWSGGITWKKDKKGNDFIASSCQGIGASIWWPNKDHGYDEPDNGINISATVPEGLTAVANGRLKKSTHDRTARTKTFHWQVKNPINNYGVNVNIGNYVNFSEKVQGEGGVLDMDYWVLAHNEKKARIQFREAPRTIKAFEHWFGKYPFYEDSFKLVEVPYLGMEHQSSVTYGNGYQNGYRGTDLSGTGVGLKFDFIVVHEAGHEWFGNNISMIDAADMWIHEGFTNYSENLFVEYHFSKKEAQDYVIGTRKRIQNDQPIISTYGVNKSGSSDMYYKGGNMLHTIRQVVNDDEKWREILRGLNKVFWHKTVTTKQVEDYISKNAGFDFSKVFDQYLRNTKIPRLRYKIIGSKVAFKYDDVVTGFNMPLKVWINGKAVSIRPDTKIKTMDFKEKIKKFKIDRNFYVKSKSMK